MFGMVLFVVLFSSLMFYAEKGGRPDADDPYFGSIPATFWWTIVTLTTVGYGDCHVQTVGGKLVAMVTMIFGILSIALPMSIIGNQFQEVYAMMEKEDNEKEASEAAQQVEKVR